MSDNDVQIAFGGDASGATSAAGEAKTAVTSIYSSVKDLGSSLVDLGETAKTAFDALKGSGGVEAASALGGLAAPALAVARALVSVGEAAWDAGKPMAAAADATAKLSEKYGVSATTAQTYQGVAALLGKSVDTVAKAAASGQASLGQYNAILDQYGVRSQDAVERGGALSNAFKENQLAVIGVNNVMTEALAPTLKTVVDGVNGMIAGFLQSYNSGGLAKAAMEGLAVTLKTVETAFVAVGEAIVISNEVSHALVAFAVDGFRVMAAAIGMLKPAWDEVVRFFVNGVHTWMASGAPLAVLIKNVGQGFRDILPTVEGAINTMIGWVNQLTQTLAHFLTSLPVIGPLFSKMGANSKTALDEITTSAKASAGALAKIWTPDAKAAIPRPPQPLKPKPNGGASGGAGSDPDQSMLSASQADWDKHFAQLGQDYDKDAAQYKAALAQKAQAGDANNAKATAASLKAIDDQSNAAKKGVADQLASTRAGIEEQIAAVKQLAEEGQISRSQESAQVEALHAQATAAMEAAATKQYQIDADRIAKRIALEKADTAKIQEEWAIRLGLGLDYQDRLNKIAADGLRQQDEDRRADLAKFKQEWDAAINPLVSSFTTGLLQMAERTKSFAQVMAQLGQRILQDFISNVIDKKVEAWLWAEVAQTATSQSQSVLRRGIDLVESLLGITTAKTAAAADITTSAGEAFAAAWASTAAIPIIGPALAPAAAASAYAGAMAGLGLASAAGGYDIPSGVNPLVQAHQNEMILPARIANPMRDMLANYQAANFNAPAAANGGGGDTHNHYYSIHAMDGPSFRGFLRGNADHLSTVLQEMGRRGQKTG